MDSQKLDRLIWILDKQSDIVHQISEIKRKAESGEPIQHMGELPKDITPQSLINFQKDRYNILEVLKNCSEQIMQEWIEAIKKRPYQDFMSQAELALIRDCLG